MEHLLRDVKDIAVGTLSTRVSAQLNSLKGLEQRLRDIHDYLERVAAGTLPVNHEITYNLQNVFNLLPNLNVDEVVRAFTVTTNDQLLVVYVSALVRSVIALHNLINNKIENRAAEHKEHEALEGKSGAEKEKEEGAEKEEGEKEKSDAKKGKADAKK